MGRFMPIRARLAVALLLGGLAMFPHIGCQRTIEANGSDKFAGDRAPNPGKDDPARPDPAKPEPKRDQFGENRLPAELKEVSFDGKRALQYIRDLCALGPRISGSDGMKKQQVLLQKHFEKYGAVVQFQKFDGKQPSQTAAVPMANMIISWNADAKRRIILCGHYDTKPIADQEARERDWRKPFLSANDGTSTVAFLMELAHHMKNIPLKIGVDFVIFDGEEFINDKARDRFFLGSDHFAAQYRKDKPGHQYIAAVLIDLFAGKNAKFPVEGHSRLWAGALAESIWLEAQRQQVKSFVWQLGDSVQDDHLALNRAGIPAVDIIDFSYKHWHKLSDLPDECSAETMTGVAKVLTAWMQR